MASTNCCLPEPCSVWTHRLIIKSFWANVLEMCLAGGEGDYGDGDGYLDEKPTEDATLASGKTAAKEEAAGAQEEATPAAAAS